MTRKWYQRPQVWIALVVFLVSLVVYRATTSPNISFWDCGEFITTSHILGIPHQPGTPLYVLVGRCFDIVFGSPDITKPALKTAPAVNFMSGFFSALAVMFVYMIVLNLARRADSDSGWLAHAGGVVGALFLMLSETYWNNAIEAEVYGLAAFIMTLVTWLALRWYDECDRRRSDWLLFMVIYLLGLGVGFHLGSLLVYPGIVVMALLAKQRKLPLADFLVLSLVLGVFILWTLPQDRPLPLLKFLNYGHVFKLAAVTYIAGLIWRSLGGRWFALIGSGLFLLGLSVHLFMLLRAPLDPAINQSQPDNLTTLIEVLRREQYPPMDFFKRQADLAWQLRYYYDYFIRQFYFVGNGRDFLSVATTVLGPIFLGLLGIIHGIRRVQPVFWLVAVSYIVNADILNLYLNFTDHEVRDRDYFFFAGFLFFTVFIGLGAAALLRYAAGREGKSAAELEEGEKVAAIRTGPSVKLAGGLLVLIAALPLVLPGHVKWYEHDRSQNTIAYEYAWNILAGLDQDAVLFTNGDNDTFPIWYLQEVEHFRRDVTVVNLSLVNLPWYVKQMRRREPPMPLKQGQSDKWIDDLNPVLYEDPKTGERQLVYVRDFVVNDIITANARSDTKRPVFFAVTIPHENMAAYYPYLQMEGLAYRLLYTKSQDNSPVVDADRLMENMFGIYDYRGLMDGDTDQRWGRFREAMGWESDALTADRVALGHERNIPYQDLLEEIGRSRVDIFRDTNTRHLLGNYPAALVRAGYEFLLDSQASLSSGDTIKYDDLTAKALAAFELASRFDHLFQPVIDIFPLLLVEQGRSGDALNFLDSLHGQVVAEQEERSMFETVFALARIGNPQQAKNWLEERIQQEPDRKFLYDLLFKLYYNLDQIDGCEAVLQRWQQRSSQVDPAMLRDLEALREKALQREQKRIEEAVEENR